MRRRSVMHPGPCRDAMVRQLRHDLPRLYKACLKLMDSPSRDAAADVGERWNRPKLTARDVRAMRRAQKSGTALNVAALATKHGCGESAIRRVLNGETWRDVVA